MAVRTDQLVRSVIAAAVANQVVYTAAANTIVIVKEVVIDNQSGNVKTVTIDVGPGGNSTAIVREVVAATTVVRLERWSVLLAAQTLRATITAAGNCGLLISGAELVIV